VTIPLIGKLPSWRSVAARLDLVRSTGPRHAWRRLQRDRALRALTENRRERIARALWTDAARELDATMTELEPRRLEIRRGTAVTTVEGQMVTLNSKASIELAADKPAVYSLLSESGIPIPEHLAFESRDTRGARSFLAHGPIPCIVKPARGSGGDGVTGEICSVGEFRRAVLAASRFAPQLLIERQLAGDVVRFLVLDGQVLDVILRLRPAIIGDGRSTVEDLICAEYDRRIRGEGNPGLKPFVVDLDCILSLRRAGIPLRSVPPRGSTVRLKTVTNYNRPEDNHTLRTAISPALSAEVAAAAATLGLRLAGVDVVSLTPSAPLAASGGAIIDVNALPALHHHAHVADADGAGRVAVPILRALLERPRQGCAERVTSPAQVGAATRIQSRNPPPS
jgi:cyanophycin synthetase